MDQCLQPQCRWPPQAPELMDIDTHTLLEIIKYSQKVLNGYCFMVWHDNPLRMVTMTARHTVRLSTHFSMAVSQMLTVVKTMTSGVKQHKTSVGEELGSDPTVVSS